MKILGCEDFERRALRGIFKDLIVWQKAMDVADCVYSFTEGFPTKETYGITSQMRRSAVSVPSNIAEGNARNSKKEFRHFLGIAKGSLAELETQVILSFRRNYLSESDFEKITKMTREVDYLLYALIKNLKPTTSSKS